MPVPGTKTSSQPSKEDGGPSHSKDKRPFRPGHWRGDYLSTVNCCKCGKQGHVASRCPEKAMYCVNGRHCNSTHQRVGLVEGRVVKNVVLDTGCSKTIVHHSLVPEEKLVTGEAVTIRCAHRDSVLYPLANVDLVVEGVPLTVEAAVFKSLPVSVLLGTDVPELAKFVGGKARGTRRQGNEAWMVVTRAGARKQEEEEKTLLQKEKVSQVKPSPVETELAEAQSVGAGGAEMECAETPQSCTLDDDLFSGGRSKVKLPRSQKRAHKQLPQHKMGTGALDIAAVELQMLQKEDPSVANLKVGAGELQETHYYRSDGLLYRQWIPRGCNAELAVDQLVLLTWCRKAVLQLAHEVPIAGHLGKHKTAIRILRRFYWPTLYKDVEDFCRSCQVCQKFSKQKVVKAPLIPLPVVTEPFRRVAMDIVGPLPRNKSGNRYILVMCDYTTRYPEAVPVKAVDAEHIAEELVRILARVGIPNKMLTDQGSNFTSQLL